jgi:predicted metal-dependent phosphoesterase TrpH
VLKVELHAHSGEDPVDRIPYSTEQLIDRAARLCFDALAITLHERQLDIAPWIAYAQAKGVTLIPGVERTIEGKHVLLLNFREGAEEVETFADLARLRQHSSGLVVAPHPYFPTSIALRERLHEHGDLFDAVEWNAMFTAKVNFNRAAREWADQHGKPLVGNGDVHRLRQLGTTYSLVDAEPHPDAICNAIRAGRVSVQSTPHSVMTAAALVVDLFGEPLVPRWAWPAPSPSRQMPLKA